MENIMIKKLKVKFIAVITAVMLLTSLTAGAGYYLDTVSGGETVTEQTNKIIYNFANQSAGSAYGKITVSTENPGTYSLYWGDNEGNRLKYNGTEFTDLGDVTTTSSNLSATYQVASEYTAIPEGAEKLLLCDSEYNTVSTYNIPDKKQFHEGPLLYKFGLLSDVHFNRYSDFSDDDSVGAFDNALKFMNDQGIDFIGLTGDLSDQGEDSSYAKFNRAIGKYSNMTVYTCMGNHDVSWTENAEKHVKSFAKQVNTKRITDKNIKSVSSNGVDFVYEKGGDIFVFFSQTKASYNKSTYLVSPEQLTWLEKTLNTYANRNVYLFFHTYFAADNGDVTKAVGNLKNPGGYTYDLTYVFGNPSEVRFRRILNKYPNVTMFNGHSHWAYDQQKYNGKLNIGNINSKKTGASLVHLASVSAPRTIEANSDKREENNGLRSEGTVALKYKNSTVYMSTDFKSGKYMAYATYINTDGKKGMPEPIIKTGKTKIKSVGKVKKISKKSKKYKVLIKYKKVSYAYKYEIQYSTSRKFKAKKTKTKRTNKLKYTITKLKNKTTYYIRVRAYRYQFGEKVYGKWTKVKRLKIKKK